MNRSFRFVDEDLNRRLIALLEKRGLQHAVDQRGRVRFSSADDELVENELIGAIRNRAFPAWQVLSCPSNWTDRYRQYMKAHDIPFQEEIADGQVCFLLPRQHRPHAWKLAAPEKNNRSTRGHKLTG